MKHAELAQVAALVGAVGVVLALVARRRLELAGGFLLLAGAEVCFGVAIAGGDTVRDAVGGAAAALAFVALAVLGGFAALLVRLPALVTPLVLVAAPFRLPLEFGGENRFFVAVAEGGRLGRLLPLYAVLAAAVLALLYRALRTRDVAPLPRVLALPASAFLAFAGLSLLWSDDVAAGANLLAFFLLPFGALVAVVARAPFPGALSRALATIAIALGALFALIGLWQQATRENFFYAPNLEVANSYTEFFRVTSLFRDPSLYGRHVVLALAVVVVLVWLRRIHVALAGALIALLWMGLYFSYSQSSMAALFAAVLGIAAVAGGRVSRRVVALGAVGALLVGAGLVTAAIEDDSAQRVTSGRSKRAELTARVFREHPLAGVGVGAQPAATEDISKRYGPEARFVSHTTPLTVAAELGIVGLAAYVAFLLGAAVLLEAVRRHHEALGLALGAVFLALFVHALFYSGFVEDPMTWLVPALGASYLLARGDPAALAAILPRRGFRRGR